MFIRVQFSPLVSPYYVNLSSRFFVLNFQASKGFSNILSKFSLADHKKHTLRNDGRSR